MPFPSINAGGLECLSWLGLSYALWRDRKGGGDTSRMEKLKNKAVTKGKKEDCFGQEELQSPSFFQRPEKL